MDQSYQEGCTSANQRMRLLYGPRSHGHIGLDLALNPSYEKWIKVFKKKVQVRSSSNERNGRMAPTNIVSLDYTWHKILVNLPSYGD